MAFNANYPPSAWLRGTYSTGWVFQGNALAAGDATFLEIDVIPQEYAHLMLRIIGQQTTGSDPCVLTVNGVTTSTYDDVAMSVTNGSGPASYSNTGAAGFYCGNLPTPNAPGSTIGGYTVIEIPFYSKTDWDKTALITNGYINNSISDNTVGISSQCNNDTTAITSVKFTSGGGNLIAGTVMQLYLMTVG